MNKSWTLEVKQHEDGDYFIEFPDEVLAEVGWAEGDTLKWIDNGNGSWSLKKLDKNQENTESLEK
jgi:bifunctional DNA-binding transcriptional regulator/antitoxin component of YhaV-PrlF toxin-antitoxin module